MPDDLEPILHVGRRSDGLYHLEDFCRAADINKFARYKPVSYPQYGSISDAQRESVAHGITIPDVVTSSALTGAAIMDACGNDWSYQMPTGGAAAPYRESDFIKGPGNTVGYYHDAVPPIQINYPSNGWTYTRGSISRAMPIYADLDPDDSTYNLQSYDFVAQGLDLNTWRLIAYVDSPYFSTHLFGSDDTILSDGEISGNTIFITIPSGSGSYTADVYICMYRYRDGRYEFIPLPKQGDYNQFPMELHIKDDASESGGGIEGDVFQNTQASYALDGEFRPLADFTDGGEAKWAMRSLIGSLFFRIPITNKSGHTVNIPRNAFALTLEDGDYTANFMYDEDKRSISSFNIDDDETVIIYLEFTSVMANLSGWYTSTKNDNRSFDLYRGGAYLVGSDMYAFYGTDGWVARSS